MATQTPRFSLNKYSDGDDNWTHSDTVDKIDEFAIDRGVVADRPNSGSYDGELYFATDDDILYRWDSGTSSWEERFYAKSSTPTWTGKHSFDSGISLNGNIIENIGGTADASDGAIRLANDKGIFARNSGDSSNLSMISTDSNDNIIYGGFGNYNTIELGDNLGGEINANNNIDLNSNSITNAASVSTDDSVTVTTGEAGGTTLHYGSDQDRANAGAESVALGFGARANGDDGSGGSISQHVAVGYGAAQNNTGDRATASGHQAAQNNTGDRATASGYQAARGNTGFGVTASGYLAARGNTGDRATASGYQAAQNNTGDRATASGYRAAQNNTGFGVTASGYQAAQNNTGFGVTASGYLAAQNNTGDRATASGHQAARGDGLADPTTMGDDNIGIGESAIRNNQASGLIAIGQDAGINAQTDDQLIITQRDGTRRMVMDLTTGDLSITGSLNENATL